MGGTAKVRNDFEFVPWQWIVAMGFLFPLANEEVKNCESEKIGGKHGRVK
jgi:hypothetical protein